MIDSGTKLQKFGPLQIIISVIAVKSAWLIHEFSFLVKFYAKRSVTVSLRQKEAFGASYKSTAAHCCNCTALRGGGRARYQTILVTALPKLVTALPKSKFYMHFFNLFCRSSKNQSHWEILTSRCAERMHISDCFILFCKIFFSKIGVW